MAVENIHASLPHKVNSRIRTRTETAFSAASAPAKVLLIALWFALFTGLAEVTLLAIAKFAMNRYINYFGQGFIWMAPLAEALFFVIVAVVLLLAGWLWPRRISQRVTIFFFAFLSLINLFLIYQRLHRVAVVVLAIGLATQLARFLAAHFDWFYWFARRTTLWMATFVLALSLGIWGWQSMAQRRALATLPAAQPNAPNVLLIVLDTVRAQNLSLYGYARHTTPNLEKLAKTGVVFDRAISTAPWTLPSHASMFTGRNQHELSVGFASKLDTNYPTLAETLSAQGYLTAGFVANTWYCGQASGLNRGFTHYEDLAVSPGQIIVSSTIGRAANGNLPLRRAVGYSEVLGRKTAPKINDSFLRWLSRKDQHRPFFAFINYFDAHEPYLPPEPYDVKFGPKAPRRNARHDHYWNWSPSEIQAEMDAYDGAIAALDHDIGKLLDQLRERGVLDNTLVIITADHGEEFGEHGIMDHGYSLYMPLLHVPLIVSFPDRIPASMRFKEPVSLRDLPATVMDLLKLGNESRFPGTTLARFWGGAVAPQSLVSSPLLSELEFTPYLPETYPISKGEMKSLITSQYHYIRNGDNSEELYDLENDPGEKRNLADSEEGRQVCERFRASLEPLFASSRAAN